MSKVKNLALLTAGLLLCSGCMNKTSDSSSNSENSHDSSVITESSLSQTDSEKSNEDNDEEPTLGWSSGLNATYLQNGENIKPMKSTVKIPEKGLDVVFNLEFSPDSSGLWKNIDLTNLKADIYVIANGELIPFKAIPHNHCRADAKSDFSSDCTETTQEYCRISRSFCAI